MSGPISAEDLATDFLRLNEQLQAGGDRTTALQRLVHLAATSVPGCDRAAVTEWPQNGRPRSIALTDEVAQTADHIQYALGDGPCLAAAAHDETVHLADLSAEGRWPEFRAAVLRRTPIRSLLSFQIHREPGRAALNLYGGRPDAFDRTAIAVAALFAAHARVLLLHAGSSDRAAQLTDALASSRQIGTAVGILMNIHKIPADEAFALLRTSSQHLNRKLRLVADEVARTGELPSDPGAGER